MSGSTGRTGTGGWGIGQGEGAAARLRRRFPTCRSLQRRTRWRVPRFAYDFVAGGVGDGAPNVAHNRAAMDAVRIVPRYGIDVSRVDISVRLFGRDYAMPVGVAPMGNTGLLWPRADAILAAAAQKARIPYCSSTVANVAIEELARIAPDVFWFQLYGLPGDDHRLSFDLIARAERAGAHALLLTVDVPVRQKRVQDVANGLSVPFRWRPRTVLDIAASPRWAIEVLRHGQPRFANFRKYLGESASTAELAAFVYNNVTSGLTWEVMARIRDAWPRALILKGPLHPEDAERAIAIGFDGLLVTNHGGRQLDAAPASIDVLPAIVAQARGRATVLLDGSVQSGLDVARALALGAAGTLAGRAFLWSVGALGEAGGDHAAASFREEISGVFAQIGARSVEEAGRATVLHPNAVRFAAAAPAAAPRREPVEAG
ncbi:alpha-hydroxy acid oxidase [Caldovatus aquaticus]|uniref:Alpha-hydroxy-acid oxidizing protein n=1 Tax=Caldovatus aquaticus TaxID=2865671 RepID=A0ABS7F478_9PROT|nr:alpha-hydroxy acid oxidase [Caldovatus aquaticus]MBW8270414.1 alpha-hydroxy-acid oxidizing protein [Caldovatus aquaticus]